MEKPGELGLFLVGKALEHLLIHRPEQLVALFHRPAALVGEGHPVAAGVPLIGPAAHIARALQGPQGHRHRGRGQPHGSGHLPLGKVHSPLLPVEQDQQQHGGAQVGQPPKGLFLHHPFPVGLMKPVEKGAGFVRAVHGIISNRSYPDN